MKVICRFMACEAGDGSKGGGKMAVLEFAERESGATRRLTIHSSQDVAMQWGDGVKCLAGRAVVLVNPATRAGAFILTASLPAAPAWNERTELAIDEESTRIRPRGSVRHAPDIGGIRGGAATTR